MTSSSSSSGSLLSWERRSWEAPCEGSNKRTFSISNAFPSNNPMEILELEELELEVEGTRGMVSVERDEVAFLVGTVFTSLDEGKEREVPSRLMGSNECGIRIDHNSYRFVSRSGGN